VKSIPALVQAMKALVGEILDGIPIRDSRRMADRIYRMACRGDQANQALTADEVRQLCRDLDSIPFASNCPHGRPVFIELPAVVIERMFKRT
jgi:DNA mismatch repair protein MutL